MSSSRQARRFADPMTITGCGPRAVHLAYERQAVDAWQIQVQKHTRDGALLERRQTHRRRGSDDGSMAELRKPPGGSLAEGAIVVDHQYIG